MPNLTIKRFSDINLYSNKNIEKVMSSLIAESANGILVSVFDDSLILFDNYEQEFYTADYEFDQDHFFLDNFEKVNLTRDKSTFNESVVDFFRGETDIDNIVESYENIFSEQEKLLSEDINKKLYHKNSKYEFFNSILEAKKDIDLSKFHSTKLFENYSKRAEEYPTQEIYYFDWHNPVRISMYQTESEKIYIKTDKQKALNIWKEENFRKSLTEAASILLEDVVGGQEALIKLLETYKDVISLSHNEFKEIVSKSLIMEDAKDSLNVVKGIMHLYETFDLGRRREELAEKYNINEQEALEGDPADAAMDAPPEATSDEIGTTITSISELRDKVEDEDAKSFLGAIVERLETMQDEGSTDPELLKEISMLLAPVPAEEEQPEKEPTAEVPVDAAAQQ